MKKIVLALFLLLIWLGIATVRAQDAKYAPLSEYTMTPDAELALAISAGPENISDHATIKVLTSSGYQVAHQGNNGFVCMVMRGWSAPTYSPAQFRAVVYEASIRAHICFTPTASQTVMPYYKLRSKLGMEGKTPDQIRRSGPSGLCQRRATESGQRLFRLHVVCGQESRTGDRPLASSPDGVRTLLRQRDA
jgi:hypothetical protein